MATEQATGAVGFADSIIELRAKHAARWGPSCKTGNALCRHIFPAASIAFWRTTVGVTAFAKAISLGGKP